nr:DDE-type integrase/transposase/recombinase [Pseudorhodobacter aquimaris]
MIEPNNSILSIGQQCRLLSISRSSFYYKPKGETEQNLSLMRRIDEQFLETPFFGVRQMTWHLRSSIAISIILTVHKPAERPLGERETDTPADAPDGADADLPKTQHQQACERAQDVSLPAERSAGRASEPSSPLTHASMCCRSVGARILPICPCAEGSSYLAAIMDWHTRKVLAWRISNTLEADFCVAALNEAIHKFGPPEIMNTDQGSQFTSFAWTDDVPRGTFAAPVIVEHETMSVSVQQLPVGTTQAFF